MKLRWCLAFCAAAIFAAFGSTTARAQEHHGDHEHHEHHWDEHHPAFDDHEREVAHRWAVAHHERRELGFRVEDRLPPEWETRFRVGLVFDAGWRRRCYPVPADLLVELPPPPHHYRYYAIGGRVVLVDPHWQVVDILSFNF
ncbi:MAG TPA: hypothetical protein VLY23_18595 [Candidatus Acidoferrum sp.]|nr:hypothetical protein [Candidatus Acidoferrum sp.]